MAVWENLTQKPLDIGYNVSVAPSLLPKGASPKIENLRFTRGRVESDFGYAIKGQAVRGEPRIVCQYDKKSGVSEILLITNLTLYKWAGAEWQYVAAAASTNADGGEPAAETDLVVDDITGFSNGDYIGVIMDNGKQHRTTINGAPSGVTIVMTDAVPAGRSIPDNAVVVLACLFTGQANKPVTYANYPADDGIVISNESDTPQIYDGSSCEDIPNLVTACGGASCTARCVKVKDNKVILFGLSESGVDYPQRVRWAATGDHTDWTTTGDAGYEDLYNSQDHIRTAEHVGPYLIVYRDESIYRMEYVGTADLIYSFENMLDSDGAVSAHGVIVKDANHVVMGSDGFYVYSGGYETTEFGTEIWHKIYGDLATLNATYKSNIHVEYAESLKKYFFMLPSDGESKPSRVWIYDLKTSSWTTRVFTDQIISMSEIKMRNSDAWIDAVGIWSTDTIPWNDPSVRVGESTLFMPGIKDGSNYVFEYSDSYTDDDGETISCEFQTGELHYPGYQIRLDRIGVVGKGTITIAYSVDEGSSWSTYGTATCGSSYVSYTVWKQLVDDRIMFRFTGNSIGLDLIQIFWKLNTDVINPTGGIIIT